MIKIDIKKYINGEKGKFLLNIKTNIKDKSFNSIIGNSGAGKTTILRILSGLENPDEGEIIINNEIVFSSKQKINIPPQKRNIGFLFQDYALFPHLNVYQNLIFGLNSKKDSNKINKMIDLMKLDYLKYAYPHNLSGGQKQRLALARCIICEKKILLLDEPLNSIDENNKIKIQNEILKYHKEFYLTTILVSHDISEVYRLSNRIFYLNDGEIKSDLKLENLDSKLDSSFNAKIINIKNNNPTTISILVNAKILNIQIKNKYKLNIGDLIKINIKDLSITKI